MTVHILEAGYETPGRPAVLLLHGFPELAYSWRKVMLSLAAAGYHVIAPDQRGYGRTIGWDDSYDADPDPFRILNMTRDAIGLVYALGHRSVAMVVGHDAGAPVASWSALIRPDIFRSITIMSSPFEGAPVVAVRHGERRAPAAPGDHGRRARCRARQAQSAAEVLSELSAHAAAPTTTCCMRRKGLHAFFRAYYFYKSADYKGNNPHPLKARTAEEMAQIPDLLRDGEGQGHGGDRRAVHAVAADYIANCKWLTEAEVDVYATEYGRTGFTGALQGYRVRRGSDPKSIAEMHTFSGRTIDVPSQFIAGKSDWGVVSNAGRGRQDAHDRDDRMVGFHLLDGAGHWVQQEQPEQVSRLLLAFLKEHAPQTGRT